MNTQSTQSDVTLRIEEGEEIRCGLVRLTRQSAVFEVLSPLIGFRGGEVLAFFKISSGSRLLYSGGAVVRNQIQSGASLICEVSLSDKGWNDFDVGLLQGGVGGWEAQYQAFLQGWQTQLQIQPEYKLMVADMKAFLFDLSTWLAQVEHGIALLPEAVRAAREDQLSCQLADTIIPSINDIFDRFEDVAIRLNPQHVAAHASYMRRHLHALALLAPFAHRTYTKPLGYAGDYEMVNMILRDRPEGTSLFGKILHAWFVRQQPARAHRNRIDYLISKITQAALPAMAAGRRAAVFNMACGPASEVQRFISESAVRGSTEFTLLDFNEETLAYAKQCISRVSVGQAETTPVKFIQRSVHHLLKDSARRSMAPNATGYDLVYCAGLFDYLTDEVCRRLMDIMYDWVVPGGLLVATNVEPSNPRRHGMDHLLDWPLIYRTAGDMMSVKPGLASTEDVRAYSDDTGVNVFLEVRKPGHG